ncbi:hypothetical protein EYC80_002332 [Monilinia laxa]|uniref:Uncharacterized protein n=1 Tax=Monilinia laxa TaxID=61186 RepID=A0A5N6K459_MONLA|nr:hypothetical protein EYC80_002332 [Monilinia laxa]
MANEKRLGMIKSQSGSREWKGIGLCQAISVWKERALIHVFGFCAVQYCGRGRVQGSRGGEEERRRGGGEERSRVVQ